MIQRRQNKYYVEIFTPKHTWKYLGKIITFKDETRVFCTHIKNPEKHFYIKRQGYPVNKELIDTLHNIHISYIMIPEQGKTGFRSYIANTHDYLHAEEISEPCTERQRVIPLRNMTQLDIPEEKLKRLTL